MGHLEEGKSVFGRGAQKIRGQHLKKLHPCLCYGLVEALEGGCKDSGQVIELS